MFCVAIFDSPIGDPEAPARLGAILGCTAYEARSRLIVSGPCVVATFPSDAAARELAAALTSNGFRALVRSVEQINRPQVWQQVRELAFDVPGLPDGAAPKMLRMSPRNGAPLVRALSDISFVIHGVAVASEEAVVVTTKKKFSAARAGLTAGIASRKKVKTTAVERGETREMFLHIYVPGQPISVVGETAVDYSGWPGHSSQGRASSFQRVVELLMQHCGDRYDRRLLKRVGQKQLLGPRLNEELHMKLCSALIVGALAAG